MNTASKLLSGFALAILAAAGVSDSGSRFLF